MKLHILGAGAPVATATRHGTSYVLETADEYVMFDCGPAATDKLVKAGIRPTEVGTLLFTHHHFDHNIDYPCLLFSRWNEASDPTPLNVYGPTLTERITHRILDEHEGAFASDWLARINHPLSLNAYTKRGGILPRQPPEADARDIGPGAVVEGASWKMRADTALHVQPWLDSLAYRVDTEAGSVVITGDTAPCDSVTELARGVDTMVTLCVDFQAEIDGTPEGDYMSGTTSVARMAQAAGARRLVLTHQTRKFDPPGATERAVHEIREIYEGEIIWSQELQAINL